MSDFKDVLRSRVTADSYDSAAAVPRNDLEAILGDAALAPSSFNLQHCRYIIVGDIQLKEQLAKTSLPSNKERILQAPLSLILVGDTDAHRGLESILDRCVAQKTLARGIADEWLRFATKFYSEHKNAARDEALRSCSLAAMALMLTAADRGYSTSPIGFNAPALIEILRIPDRFVPAMWITLGRGVGGRRRPRLPLPALMTFDSAPPEHEREIR